ncbi:MAG: YceD family protein [Candidatus Promineifilaceae bacterium]
MRPHTTNKLHFNFGFLLSANPGEHRRVEMDYPAVRIDELHLEPLTGYFKASRTAQGIFLRGKLTSFAEAECARCNSLFLHPMSLHLDDHYYLPEVAPLGEYTIEETGKLDLGPLVRELAITAVPMQPVCKEACQGLCIECGTNLNETDCGCVDEYIDPRFAILQQLLEKKE